MDDMDNYAFVGEWDCQVATNAGKIRERIKRDEFWWINERDQAGGEHDPK